MLNNKGIAVLKDDVIKVGFEFKVAGVAMRIPVRLILCVALTVAPAWISGQPVLVSVGAQSDPVFRGIQFIGGPAISGHFQARGALLKPSSPLSYYVSIGGTVALHDGAPQLNRERFLLGWESGLDLDVGGLAVGVGFSSFDGQTEASLAGQTISLGWEAGLVVSAPELPLRPRYAVWRSLDGPAAGYHQGAVSVDVFKVLLFDMVLGIPARRYQRGHTGAKYAEIGVGIPLLRGAWGSLRPRLIVRHMFNDDPKDWSLTFEIDSFFLPARGS